MADDTNSTEYRLDLDVTDAIESVGKFTGALGDIGENLETVTEIASTFGQIALVLAPVAVAVGAFKEALDLSMEAEQIQSVQQGFDELAKNAGLSGEELKKSLEDASGGLINTTDLLQAGSKAIIQLGTNASQMGQLMTVARQASAVFGGSVTENFQGIVQAVSTGNQRMLKHLGLTVDVNKAYQDYANSLGVSVSALTEVDKQQAVLNAVIEKAATAYQGVNLNIKENTNLWQQFKTTLSEIGESATVAFNKIAGPTVTTLLKSMQDSARSASNIFKELFPQSDAEKNEAHIDSLKQRIQSLKKELDDSQSAKGFFAFLVNSPSHIADLQKNLEKAQTELQKIDQQEMQHAAWKNKNAAEEQKIDENKLERDKAVAEQKKQFMADLAAIKEKNDAEATKADAQILSNQLKNASTAEEFIKLTNQKKLNDEKQYDESINKLEQEMQKRVQAVKKNEDKLTATQRAAEVKEIKKMNDTIVKLRENRKEFVDANAQEEVDIEIAAYQQEASKATEFSDAFSATFKANSLQNEKDAKDFSKLASNAYNDLGNNAVSAFEAMGSGAQTAGQAMTSFMFNSIGDIAEAQGRMMLLSALTNPAMGAAGAALIVLGALLKSQAGSAATTSAVGGGSSDLSSSPNPAVAANPATGYVAPIAGPSSAAASTIVPGRSVTLNVQGNLLMSNNATRQWLVEQLRQASDASDFRIQTSSSPGL